MRKLSDAPIDVAPAPPLFGEAVDVAQPPKRAPLTIALAGPYTLDREREFARSITAVAAHFAVSGCVVRRTTQDDSSSLARLLPTGTPFAGGATGSSRSRRG